MIICLNIGFYMVLWFVSQKNAIFAVLISNLRMTNEMTITVYGASSSEIDKVYTDAAFQLGCLAAMRGVAVVDGGGKTGIMGAVNDGALSAGGVAIGVIPQFMDDKGWAHPGLSRLDVTKDMHDRKKRMAELADGVIAMPGGVGTFEELLEMITWRKLNLYSGPVVIYNVDGFYNLMIEMLEYTIEHRFMKERLWLVATSADEALDMACSKPRTKQQ